MITRFIASAAAGLLLFTGLLADTAYAADAPASPNPILCGLKVGASLDVSHASDCLKLYGQDTSSTPSATPQPSMPSASSQPGTPSASGGYIALGDSVAAGLGLPGSNSTQCGRSPLAYPDIVAEQLNLPLTSYACSGATAGDLVTQQHIGGTNPAAQLDAAFANDTPDLITITAGANDAHWADFVTGCYRSNCATAAYTAAANAYLAVLQLKLQYAFGSIQNRSHSSPPRVIITGYYNPVSSACNTVQPAITSDEIAWIQQETAALNQTILDSTSAYSFVHYAPISFSGHDICSASPWVQGLSDPAPLHPTARGQQAIAAVVIQATTD